MAKQQRASSRSSGSWIVAAALVVGAGAVTWFGMGASDAGRPAPQPTETLAVAADPATPEPIVSAPAPAGALPTRVVVPSVGIDAAVDEVGVVAGEDGLVWETAWAAAGHHIDSARPGQPGNVVLTGHVSVADSGNVAVFAGLDRVTVGDVVEVQAGARTYRYEVTELRVVPPGDVSVLASDHHARLTLITCTTDLSDRLVVIGSLLEEPSL